MKSVFLLAVGLSLATAGAALADEHGNASERCLEIGRIYNWQAAKDDRSLIVESDTHHKYKLDLMGYCHGLRFKERLAFKSPGGAYLSCISPGDSVIFRDMGMTQRCFIRKVTPLEPAADHRGDDHHGDEHRPN